MPKVITHNVLHALTFQHLCIFPTLSIHVFCIILTIISDCFGMQHSTAAVLMEMQWFYYQAENEFFDELQASGNLTVNAEA